MNILSSTQLHFIGIGGCGMSGIARLLLQQGYAVSGSDITENTYTLRLRDLGATIFLKHKSENIHKADAVVLSTAITDDNPELIAAKEEGLPIYHRADILNFLLLQFKDRLTVCGTHGKTTTTSMLARIFMNTRKKATYVIGGELSDFGSNAELGKSDLIVAEADESDGSFLKLASTAVVLTNVEPDHMDYYLSEDALEAAFDTYIRKVVEQNGLCVINADDAVLMRLVKPYSSACFRYYGITEKADVSAENIQYLSTGGMSFDVIIDGKNEGEVLLNVIGQHNVYNALAAVTYCLTYGVSIDTIKKGLCDYVGTKRRFQHIGAVNGIDVYDDYAHHPTEIKTTLSGVKKSFGRRTYCLFQPHRFSRTRDFLEGFPIAFEDADKIIITDIYSASERKIEGITGKLIVDKMDSATQLKTNYVPHKSDVALHILNDLKPGDLVITMGAGDIHTVGKELLAQLRRLDSHKHEV